MLPANVQPHGVVVEVFRAAELVDRREILLQIVGHVVEELVLVDRAVRSALGARAVVGDEHDQRVVELAQLLEEVDQAADVVVGVLEEAGEHLHHARIQLALVRRQRLPVLHVRIVARELRVLRARCRAPSAASNTCSRYTSQPSSNLPLYLSAHSFGT